MGRQATTASRLLHAPAFNIFIYFYSNTFRVFCMTLSHVSPFGKLKVGQGPKSELGLKGSAVKVHFPAADRQDGQ